jgi:ATP-dependent DNA helicase RecG
MPLRPDTSVQYLKGVGPARAAAFAKLGVFTVEDLLYHVPHRYLDASSVTPIARVAVGKEVTVVGRVVSKGIIPTRSRLRIFRAILKDQSGVVECAWPGQAFLDRTIQPGQLLLVTGPVKFYHGRQLVPREQIVLAEPDDPVDEAAEDRGVILPVYSATEGLSHRQIRRIIADHLDEMVASVPDPVPEALRREVAVMPLGAALRSLHRPQPAAAADATAPAGVAAAEQGRRRLALDELLDLQLVVARARHLAKAAPKGPTFVLRKDLTTQLKETLPFKLTAGQKTAVKEITADMIAGARMHRLLMGDVGTGKTVVALFAMLLAAENGYQAVFMAPTELLAEQHARTLGRLLAPLGIVPEVLLGRLGQADKKAVRARLAQGGARIVVGTHALFEERTAFRKLGLVVIDEQHRFGVEQRAALIGKGAAAAPDVLLLSATPIPRTLALTLYGDLDISVLKERPHGGVVKTGVRPGRDRAKVYAFLKERCAAGRQAYVVYPIISESEKVDLRAATTMVAEIGRAVAPHTVGLVHGKLKPDERDDVMRRFRDGAISVLVATTVIEVGIDVPNATVMVIEHPERFGLAQLHQLRGRVGRGDEESHCVLLSDTGASLDRLKRFARTADGFKIAELDLKERGMGELAGARQSGGISLRFTDLGKDADLVVAARRAAREMIERDPLLKGSIALPLRQRVERRYERGVELFRVG